jgi:thiol-disulfide isomerase/thioredoxin
MRLRRPGLAVGILALLAAASCGKGRSEVSDRFPSYRSVTGSEVDLDSHRGKVLLVNRWASWCGPCRSEIPDLVALRKKHSAAGFEIYGLNDEPADVQREAASKFGIDYPLLVERGSSPAFPSSGAIPESFLVDRQGNVVDALLGAQSLEELDRKVRPLLARD